MFKFHSVLRIDIHTHSELYGGFVPKVRESQFSMLILSQGGSIFGDHFQHFLGEEGECGMEQSFFCLVRR
jgi:hypothetical protein